MGARGVRNLASWETRASNRHRNVDVLDVGQPFATKPSVIAQVEAVVGCVDDCSAVRLEDPKPLERNSL